MDEKAAKAQLQQSVGANDLDANTKEIMRLQGEVENLKDKIEDRDRRIDSMKQCNQLASRRSNDAAKKSQD